MSWLKQLFSRSRRYNELSETIREHLEEKIADLMDRGMSREEAERTARREFGNVARTEERSHEVWQWPTLESLWADAMFTCRQLRRAPGFTLIAIVMACGIGASTGVFIVINSVLLRPIHAGLSILFAATLAAAFLPAYRASRIDPIRILRVE